MANCFMRRSQICFSSAMMLRLREEHENRVLRVVAYSFRRFSQESHKREAASLARRQRGTAPFSFWAFNPASGKRPLEPSQQPQPNTEQLLFQSREREAAS